MTRFLRGTAFPPVVYDLARKIIVHEFIDFSIHLVDTLHLEESTVIAHVNHIVRFANYLCRGTREALTVALAGVSSALLIEFRDEDFRSVRANRRSRSSEKKARNTVNGRVFSIYSWLWWLQTTGRLPMGTIGPSDCSVVTYLRPTKSATKRRLPPLEIPILFKDVDRGGKHATGFVASRSILDCAVDIAMSRDSSEYRNLRDALILDLATEVGLRVGSIASLLSKDFEELDLEATNEETFSIKPPHQKNSYENRFDFPVWLVHRVCGLIEARNDHIRMKGLSLQVAKGHIFINDRRCTPLTSRSMSETVSAILRKAGAPKGSAVHAFRGLFCTEEIEREIEDRLRRGLDTSTASICAAVALKMGHRNPLSLFAYVSRALSLRAARARAKERLAV